MPAPGSPTARPPRVLILTGTCGSGKSTVAGLIGARPGWERVSEDDIWRRLHHRRRGEVGTPEHRTKRLAVRAAVLARVEAALAAGRDVVVDATVHEATPDSLGEYRELLDARGVPWTLRVLHPRLEVAIARDGARDRWRAGSAGVTALWRKFTGGSFPGDAFLDTSRDTPEQTAARVLRSLEAGA